MNPEVDALKGAIRSSDLKIGVFGNCQMGHVTRCIQALVGGDWPTNEWISLEILQEMADGRRDLKPYFDLHDKVFMQPWVWKSLEARYGSLRSKVVLYPHVEFLAFHPDLVYVSSGIAGPFFVGPVGHYHSSIALLAWKSGLGISDAIKLFNGTIYRRLGFFDYWQESCDTLRNDGQLAGIPLDTLLQGWIDRGCFMHSVNHPKLFVIADIIEALLHREGIRTLPGNPVQFVRDYLADSHVWPVYPEIGEPLRVSGSYAYKLSSPGIVADTEVRMLGLEEFVERSYGAFSAHAPADLICLRLELTAYRQLMAELATPGTRHALLQSLEGAPQTPRPLVDAPVETVSIDLAEVTRTEEARAFLRPSSAFWYGSV